MKRHNPFTIALKSIQFAWQTNKTLFLILTILHAFQGSIIYLQFSSFASVVDEIVGIKQGIEGTDKLIYACITLAVSFLLPSIASSIIYYIRKKFLLEQNTFLELHRIDKNSSLDIGTIESS